MKISITNAVKIIATFYLALQMKIKYDQIINLKLFFNVDLVIFINANKDFLLKHLLQSCLGLRHITRQI
jgi:hypothetical protein